MKVVILRGISGSGKSTYAQKLIEENRPKYGLICSADSYFMKNGVYVFNPKELGIAHMKCFEKFVSLVNDWQPLIIVDNTNTMLYEIAPYLKYAELQFGTVEIVRLECSHKTAAMRNVHGVPIKTVANMAMRMEKLPRFWPKEKVIETE